MNPQILEALCTDFTAIYQCDLIQDTIDIVRFDKGTHTDMAIQTMDPYTLHSFHKMIQYFENLYIQDSAQESLWKEFEPHALIEKLKDNPIYCYHCRLKPNQNGNEYHSFRAIKTNASTSSFEVVIGVKVMDDLMEKQYKNEKRLQQLLEEKKHQKKELEIAYKQASEEDSILLALCNDYSVVYVCDLEKDDLKVIKDTNPHIASGSEFKYSTTLDIYSKIQAIYKGNESYVEKLERNNLIQAMKDRDELSLQFCINKDQANPSYMETRVVKIKSDTGFKIILGSRHIDDIVKEREEQNKQLNEALKKERTYNEIIHAIGSIYKSIATIDLKKQTYTVLSYNSSDKKITETDFKGSMNQLKQYFLDKNSTSPFVDEVLEFIDLDTIPERMKGKNILTLEMKGQDGKWHACSIIPQTYDKNHNLTNVLMTLSDIDDIKKRELEAKEKLKEAAIEAKQANLAKTNFLRRISHDIRTPLNGIVGMINLSERYSNDTDKLYECKEKVLTSLDYLLSLINDILDMNKVESGTLVLENKPFNLIDIINKIIAIVETNCEQHNIQFFGGKDMSKIIHRNLVGSGEYLNRLLMNIASNAIKYNREGGSVTLYCTELSSDDTHALYEFVCKDTGLGMSEEFQKHAFEPFTCEGKPTTTGYNGTGLGLSIVKDIVEMIHGTIQMESKENVGTTFRILLPLQIDPNPQIIKPIQTKPLNLTNKKALLVEDNDINLEIATILLQDLGLDVSTARNGQEAIDQFKKSKLYTFDYIFMDIMMPVKDGLEATKEIRALPRSDAKSVHILAMSANAFESDIQECLKAGMDGHIAKPITMELLKEKLAK